MKKIRNKIIIPITVLNIALIFALVVFFNNLLNDIYINIVKKEMSEKINFIDIIIKEDTAAYTGSINKRFSDKIKYLSGLVNTRITVIDFRGNVIGDSDGDPLLMDNHRYRIEIRDALEKKTGESLRYSSTLNVDMLYFAQRMEAYVIRLSKPLHDIDAALKRFTVIIFCSGILVIAAVIAIIIWVSGKITNPIRETRDFAVGFADGDYSKRILNFRDDEIGSLQKSLNRMADSIVAEMNQLATEQNKLQVTIESISDGIGLIDKSKSIIIANKSFIELLGINTDPLNKMFYEVIRGSELNKKIENSLYTGERSDFQDKLLTNKFCEINLIPIKEERSVKGILVIVHDITEKKRIDQLKTDLVGNLSHELKTPIAILRGYLETIQSNPADTEMSADFLSKALINLERQNSIINDMLKLNMLETMTGITFEKINLKEIISNCADILGSKARAREIDIHMDTELPDMNVDGNKFLAEEIFFNIIINAINYNVAGGTVRISAKERNGGIMISVADSGIGIPEDSLDRIFERFYRVDKSRSRATGGTGLGLSIVKHAVEMMKWRISVESGGKGSVFFIEIPANR